MRRINYINGISGVAPGGVATLNLQLNRRYHGLKIFSSVTETVSGNSTVNPHPASGYAAQKQNPIGNLSYILNIR